MGSCNPDNQTHSIPGSKIAKMLLLLALLVSQAVGLPQKVVFGREGSEEGCPGRHQVRADGECFTVGEQGPCGLGNVLNRTGGCVKNEVTTTTTTPTTTETTIATNELGCAGDKIPFEGGCHQLASTGPCQPGHWLLLVEVEEGQLMVNPYGEGICNYPVEEQGKIKKRIFENIPVNDETAFSRATLLNCYVDEANNCRRIFTLGPQPARNQARFQAADTLIDT